MLTPRSRIAIVAHDAGGARALLPVAIELQRRGWELVPLLAGPAVKIFSEAFPVEALADTTTAAQIVRVLKDRRAAVLLSASGLYNELEHTARLAARALQLQIVAIQDAWFNHRERYQRNAVTSFPDVVCVMDELSLLELLRAGFVRSQLVLTGQPGLEQTVRRCRAVTPAQAHEMRKAFGLSERGLVLTFFSDPFYTQPGGRFYSGPGAIMHPNGQGLYGYTVRDILPALLAELERAFALTGATVDLIVRPHPSECDDVVRDLVARHPACKIRARVEQRGTTEEWIQMSDALLGMMTIALLEAALAGKPAASIELGLRDSGQQDPCMANTLGYTDGVFDTDALQILSQGLAQQDWTALRHAPRHALLIEGATERVADCLLRAARLV